MYLTHNYLAPRLLSLAAILTLGCNDSTEPATPTIVTGAIEITVSTTGEDVDPDGYVVLIDGGAGLVVGVDTSVTVAGIPLGRHYVRLAGLQQNCSLGYNNQYSVDVIGSGGASPVSFAVSCHSGWDF